MKKNELTEIANHFFIEGNVADCVPFGSGHIHDTFRIVNEEPDKQDYLLQKVNTDIFGDMAKLMNNIDIVTKHLKKKIAKIPGSNPDKEVLTIIKTKNDEFFHKHTDGSSWRVFLFLDETNSYDLVENATQAYEGGKGYGRFLSLLGDLNAKQLHEVLPKFHNIESRLNLLQNAIDEDKVDRVKEVQKEIDFVKAQEEKMLVVLNMGKEGKIPLKTTHNDTKFNNILLDKNDKAQCVIDLDTVMPGYVAYDFGDAIRTIVNTANEDEKDLSKINVNMELFEGFAKGFLAEAKDNLNDDEIESLAYGCILLPFIMGVRFLTDYIDGDNYYKIHFPEHNIQRARAQFRLVERLIENFPKMQEIIKKECG